VDAATIYARRWWTLAVLCLSLLIIGLDNTILNVALPTLVRDLQVSGSSLQWIVDAYTILYASMLLTTGSLGDRFGRKGALSLGLLVFGVGSTAAAFSGSAGPLIAARGLMGLGGCLIMPATLSILTNVFPAQERGKAIGIWAGVSGLGIAVGPALGGVLLQHFWWGSVFLINIPIVVVALVAGRLLIPNSKDPSAPRLDPVGTVLSTAGLVGLLYGVIEAPSKSWGNSWVLAGFIGGLAILAAFVLWERAIDHPMLDVRFFKNPRFSGASFAVTLVFFAMLGVSFLLTQYLQFVLGFSPLRAGLGFIPLATVLMVAAPMSATLTKRFGSKLVVSGGLAIVGGALLMLSQATVHSGYPYVGLVLALLGLGMGTAMSPATDSIMGSLPKEKAGVGSAVNDTTRQVGGALGVAVLGSLAAATYHAKIAGSKVYASLPGPARAAARDSIGSALQAAPHLGAAGRQLIADASGAFVHAMSVSSMVAGIAAFGGALVALVFLPARAGDEDLPVDPAHGGRVPTHPMVSAGAGAGAD
jgi:EmrB/QacA subfamily drug resistance transporter